MYEALAGVEFKGARKRAYAHVANMCYVGMYDDD